VSSLFDNGVAAGWFNNPILKLVDIENLFLADLAELQTKFGSWNMNFNYNEISEIEAHLILQGLRPKTRITCQSPHMSSLYIYAKQAGSFSISNMVFDKTPSDKMPEEHYVQIVLDKKDKSYSMEYIFPAPLHTNILPTVDIDLPISGEYKFTLYLHGCINPQVSPALMKITCK
jgi:hypothetical protein